MIFSGELARFKLLLENTKLAGVNISSDITRLEKHYSVNIDRRNVIEVGQLAYRSGLITFGNVSLTDLTWHFTGMILQKIDGCQVSQQWAQTPLPEDHLQYTELDVLATLDVYDRILCRSPPVCDDISAALLVPGAKVLVKASGGDQLTVASATFLEINTKLPFSPLFKEKVTATRAKVRLDNVTVPIYLSPFELTSVDAASAKYRPTLTELVELDPINKFALVPVRNLRIEGTINSPSFATMYLLLFFFVNLLRCHEGPKATVEDAEDGVMEQKSDRQDDSDDSMDDQIKAAIEEITPVLAAHGIGLPRNLPQILKKKPTPCKSDMFHFMNHFKLPKGNSLAPVFAQSMSMAMFTMADEDVAAADARLKILGHTDESVEYMKKYKLQKYLKNFCIRRNCGDRHERIPQLQQMVRFCKTIAIFVDLVDEKSKKPLLSSSNHEGLTKFVFSLF